MPSSSVASNFLIKRFNLRYGMTDDSLQTLQAHIRAMLETLRTGPEHDAELSETPQRFAELLLDRFVPKERTTLGTLPTQASGNGPVVIRDIPYHALCAHHIVPFFGVAHIAYLPSEHIAGFGAFTRLVDELSRGPQLQEQLVMQIADAIEQDLRPRGVLVQLQARQMCMELTGHNGISNTVVYAAHGQYDSNNLGRYALEFFPPSTT